MKIMLSLECIDCQDGVLRNPQFLCFHYVKKHDMDFLAAYEKVANLLENLGIPEIQIRADEV